MAAPVWRRSYSRNQSVTEQPFHCETPVSTRITVAVFRELVAYIYTCHSRMQGWRWRETTDPLMFLDGLTIDRFMWVRTRSDR